MGPRPDTLVGLEIPYQSLDWSMSPYVSSLLTLAHCLHSAVIFDFVNIAQLPHDVTVTIRETLQIQCKFTSENCDSGKRLAHCDVGTPAA